MRHNISIGTKQIVGTHNVENIWKKISFSKPKIISVQCMGKFFF